MFQEVYQSGNHFFGTREDGTHRMLTHQELEDFRLSHRQNLPSVRSPMKRWLDAQKPAEA